MNGRFDSHVFEFTSLYNVTVQNCSFHDLLTGYSFGESHNHEVLQIESASSIKAFPYCQFIHYGHKYRSTNVLVSNCRFRNVLRAIGNHASSASTSYQSGVAIAWCEFVDIIEDAIHFSDNTKIINIDNTFINVQERNINLR